MGQNFTSVRFHVTVFEKSPKYYFWQYFSAETYFVTSKPLWF